MKVLITGVSSGIGRELTKKLIQNKHAVWGVSRNKILHQSLKKELKNSSRLFLTELDLAKNQSWNVLLQKMTKQKFIPNVVVFNAAKYQNDFDQAININQTRSMMELNFFSVLTGFNILTTYVLPKTHFIAITSSSGLKGNSHEGVGYASSKAALSLAFESLFQKYRNSYYFSTVAFGPVRTKMSRIRTSKPFVLTPEYAADQIISVIKNRKLISEKPTLLFLFIKLIRLLPGRIYLSVFSNFEKLQ